VNATVGAEHVRPERREAAPRTRGNQLPLVVAFACLLSLAAFAYFFRHGEILLYGDAVAHLNIARRLFDTRHPGWDQLGSVWLDQLGSVWLPLPHLLVAPFVVSDALWRSGIGGSLPSMAAYVLGVVGVYRLVRARTSGAAAWLASSIYALNPSLLYMQATAMTESIFLAALIWAVVYFDEFLRGLDVAASQPRTSRAELPNTLALAEGKGSAPSTLGSSIQPWHTVERCGICLAAAVFTRYDGWVVAFVTGIFVTAIVALRLSKADVMFRRLLVRSTASFLLLLGLCPALWLAHNYKLYRRPLDWLNGPYSAKAIERRTARPSDPPYPGKDHPFIAAQYFLKAARMNTGEAARDKWLLSLSLAGVLIALANPRRFGAMSLLWIPLPFYAYSISFGSVPIFVPEWWPFSYYNVRYGLELLPAIAVFAGLLPWGISQALQWRRHSLPVECRWIDRAATALLLVVVLLAYNSSAWSFSPRWRDHEWPRHWMVTICYREAWVNSRTRVAMEAQVAQVLRDIPANSTVLMYTSDYVGALQQAGIHFDHVVSESSFIIWDAALSAPFATADYIVAVDGDPVAEAVRINPRGLTKLAILRTRGKPDVTIYRGSRVPSTHSSATAGNSSVRLSF